MTSYPNREKYVANSDINDNDLRIILENTTTKGFLLCNPSNAFSNEDFGGKINKPFFYGNLHVINLLSYDGLMKIYEVSRHNNQNTVFITGFRGSGKTHLQITLKQSLMINGL